MKDISADGVPPGDKGLKSADMPYPPGRSEALDNAVAAGSYIPACSTAVAKDAIAKGPAGAAVFTGVAGRVGAERECGVTCPLGVASAKSSQATEDLATRSSQVA